MTEVKFDPFSVDVRANPYPHYARLREHAPVYRVERSGFHLVSRYEDVLFVLKHPELFSSRAMQMMMLSGMGAGIESMGGQGLDPAALLRLGERMKDLPFDPLQMMKSPALIAADPPNHARLRNIVNRGFTPRRIAALEPRIREIAREALDRMLSKSEFDLVSEFTIPLPVRVIAELLGVEPERRGDFKRWSDALVAGATGSESENRPEAMIEAFIEFNAYFMEVIEQRRRDPRDDLISTLVAAEDGAAALNPMETLMFAILILAAGNETTTNLIGNAVLALLDRPDLFERVRRDPALVPIFIEEALRFDSPVQMLFRQTTREVAIAGVTIPEGAIVMPIFASANRDAKQFDQPDCFRLERNPQGHLAFGFGIHFCLGSSLARLEARVAFEELFRRVAKLHPLGTETGWVDSFLLRGPRRLDLGFDSA